MGDLHLLDNRPLARAAIWFLVDAAIVLAVLCGVLLHPNLIPEYFNEPVLHRVGVIALIFIKLFGAAAPEARRPRITTGGPMAVTASTPIELINKIYGQLPARAAIGRERLGRPLTFAEKGALAGVRRDDLGRPRRTGILNKTCAKPIWSRQRRRAKRSATGWQPNASAGEWA